MSNHGIYFFMNLFLNVQMIRNMAIKESMVLRVVRTPGKKMCKNSKQLLSENVKLSLFGLTSEYILVAEISSTLINVALRNWVSLKA